MVIFGASGDLTKRKLLPALFHLEQQHLLPKEFVVVGVARRDLSSSFANDMQDGILKGGGVDRGDSTLKPFIDRVKYFATNFDNDEGFEKLKAFLADLDKQYGTKGNRLFYLAVALLAATAVGEAAMSDAAARLFLGDKITIRSAYKATWRRGWR